MLFTSAGLRLANLRRDYAKPTSHRSFEVQPQRGGGASSRLDGVRRWGDDREPRSPRPAAEDEVVDICRDLIRIDTTNPGDHSGPGERRAAEYVAGLLAEVGLEPDGRSSRTRSGPAWSRASRARTAPEPGAAHPRAPGRGARQRRRLAARPVRRGDRRRLRLGARRGRHEGHGRDGARGRAAAAARGPQARRGTSCSPSPPTRRRAAIGAPGSWSSEHADLFEGVTEAIGEVGGFSVSVGDQRLYAVQTAEKGLAWMRLTATGHRRARVDDPRRQRGHRARRGRRPDRAAPVADAAARTRRRTFLQQASAGARRRVRPAGPGPASSASSAG